MITSLLWRKSKDLGETVACRAILLVCAILMAMLMLCAGTITARAEGGTDTTGNGSYDNPYVVYTWAELKRVLSITEDTVYVQLGADVTDPDPSSESFLLVPSRELSSYVDLDLNGHKIDRGLSGSNAIENGFVLRCEAKLVLKSSTEGGCITGGNNTGNGGGIIIDTNRYCDFRDNVSVTGNRAEGNGGGIYLSSRSAIFLKGFSFTENIALNGGGLYAEDGNGYNTSLELGSGIEFTDNSASENGGGLYFGRGRKASLTETSPVTGNTAKNGGGVYLHKGAEVTVYDCELKDNHALNEKKSGDSYVSAGAVFRQTSFPWQKTFFKCGSTSLKAGSTLEFYGTVSGNVCMEGDASLYCTGYSHDSILNLTLADDFCGYVRMGNDVYGTDLPEMIIKDTEGNRHGLSRVDFDYNREPDQEKEESVSINPQYVVKGFNCGFQPKSFDDLYNEENGTFAGWNTRADGNGTHYDNDHPAMIPDDSTETSFTLYAEWTQNSKDHPYMVSSWQTLYYTLQNGTEAAGSSTSYFRLESDIMDPHYADNYFKIPEGKKVDLDLNGHIMDRNYSKTPSYVTTYDFGGISFDVYGIFTLNDSHPERTHSPAFTYTDPDTGMETEITGGIITGGFSWCEGGGIFINHGGYVKMTGGTIFGNSAETDGGGVYIEGPRSSEAGYFEMRGGAIIGNISKGTGGGGGVYIDKDALFFMYGGKICANTSVGPGGGVYVSDLSMYAGGPAIFAVSGDASVTGNRMGDDISNVYLGGDSIIAVHGDLAPYDEITGTGSRVGVTTEKNPLNIEAGVEITDGLGCGTANGHGNKWNFISDKGFRIEEISGEAVLKKFKMVSTPTFSPAPGTFFGKQTVTISCETDGASIFYTDDGSDPKENTERKLYQTPISISKTTMIRAYAVKDGLDDSYSKTAVYTNSSQKPDPTVKKEPVPRSDLVYNGQPQELVEKGEADNGTMYYAVTDTENEPAAGVFSTSLPVKTGPGTYYVWYKAVGEDGTSSEVQHVKVVISAGGWEDEDEGIWNLFEDVSEHSFEAGGLAASVPVKNTNPKSGAFYDATLSGNVITVRVNGNGKANRKKAARPANSVLEFLLDNDSDGNPEGIVCYTFPVSYVKPSFKLSSKSAVIKAGMTEKTEVKTTVLKKTPAGTYEPYDLSDDEMTVSGFDGITGDADGVVSFKTNLAGKGKITFKKADWEKAVELPYSVKESKKDVLTLHLGGLKQVVVNKNLKGQEFSFDVTFNGGELPDNAKISDKKNTGLAALSGNKLVIAYPEDTGVSAPSGDIAAPSELEASADPAAGIKDGTYTVTIEAGDAKANVKIKVSSKPVDESVAGKVKLKYDVVTGQPMVVVPNLKDLGGTITDVEAEAASGVKDFTGSVTKAGNIVVSYEPEDPAAPAYNAKKPDIGDMTLKLTIDGTYEVKTLLKKVKAKKSTPNVTAAAISLPNSLAAVADDRDIIAISNVTGICKDGTVFREVQGTAVIDAAKSRNVTAAVDDTFGSQIDLKRLTGKSGTVKAVVTYPGGVEKKVSIKVKIKK